MAAKFDPSDPSSPLHYNASQTAVLLLDFQNMVIGMLGEDGKAALSKAKTMRDWALSRNIFVLHSVVDLEGEPRHDARGRDRAPTYKAMLKQNPDIVREPPELAADASKGEVVALKQIGFVSGLTSKGAMEALRERNIRNLVVCGLSTSGAALRTALAGSDDGFVVTVIEDACADRVDGLHEMLVRHVMPMTTHVATAEEFIEKFDGGK